MEYHLKKIKPFDPSLTPIMSNLADGRVSIKFNNSGLVKKSSSLIYSKYILNLYLVF